MEYVDIVAIMVIGMYFLILWGMLISGFIDFITPFLGVTVSFPYDIKIIQIIRISIIGRNTVEISDGL